MTLVTVVIPIGPGHADIAKCAVASVEAQTTPCDLLSVYDVEQRGPGWARNQGLGLVKTPYVVFLDADDWIEPTFVERCLAVRKPLRYVYTDWLNDGERVNAPDKPWCGGMWHVVTALLPTEWVREVGGFDETLPGAEDTDFYLKIVTGRRCPQRLAEPLFHYGGHGQRAQALQRGAKADVLAEIGRRYAGKMGCCGDDEMQQPPTRDRLPGDVLAIAVWGGNRQVMGRSTGRMYPRTGNGKLNWVDPRDVAIMPDLWALAPKEPTVDEVPTPVLETTGDLARIMMGVAKPRVVDTSPVPPAPVRPDVQRVLALARKR